MHRRRRPFAVRPHPFQRVRVESGIHLVRGQPRDSDVLPFNRSRIYFLELPFTLPPRLAPFLFVRFSSSICPSLSSPRHFIHTRGMYYMYPRAWKSLLKRETSIFLPQWRNPPFLPCLFSLPFFLFSRWIHACTRNDGNEQPLL